MPPFFLQKKRDSYCPASVNIERPLLTLNTGFNTIDLSYGVVVRAFHVFTRFEVVSGGNAIHPLFAVAFFVTGSEHADEGNACDDNEYFFHCFFGFRLIIFDVFIGFAFSLSYKNSIDTPWSFSSFQRLFFIILE